MRKWRNAVVTAAWVAVGTAAGALGAWQLASSDGSGGAAHSRPLDEGAVRKALAAATSAPSRSLPGSPSPGGTPGSPGSPGSPSRSSSAPAPERSTVRFTGGSATVECRGDGTVYLVSWSPADGFHIDDDVERGPARVARVEAEPGDDVDGDDLHYEVRCVNGSPKASPAPDD